MALPSSLPGVAMVAVCAFLRAPDSDAALVDLDRVLAVPELFGSDAVFVGFRRDVDPILGEVLVGVLDSGVEFWVDPMSGDVFSELPDPDA